MCLCASLHAAVFAAWEWGVVPCVMAVVGVMATAVVGVEWAGVGLGPCGGVTAAGRGLQCRTYSLKGPIGHSQPQLVVTGGVTLGGLEAGRPPCQPDLSQMTADTTGASHRIPRQQLVAASSDQAG